MAAATGEAYAMGRRSPADRQRQPLKWAGFFLLSRIYVFHLSPKIFASIEE